LLWVDEQDIERVSEEAGDDLRPVILIVRVDGFGPHTHARCGGNLVPHERQQRRNEQGRALPSFTQQLDSDEVDETLAPACLLNYEQAPRPGDDRTNRVLLPLTKLGIGDTGTEAKQFESALRVVHHSGDPYSL
jgi:hypothetical protein